MEFTILLMNGYQKQYERVKELWESFLLKNRLIKKIKPKKWMGIEVTNTAPIDKPKLEQLRICITLLKLKEKI